MIEGQVLQGNCSPANSHPNPGHVRWLADRFYAEDDEPELQAEAKAYCKDCPAQRGCLQAGLAEPFGIWGGKTTTERRNL